MRRRLPLFATCLVALSLAASPAHAVGAITAEVYPSAPTTGDSVKLTIRTYDHPAYRLRAQRTEELLLNASLAPVCTEAPCPPNGDQVLEIDLGRLPARYYIVEVHVDGVWDEHVYVDFSVIEGPGLASAEFGLGVVPAAPDDAGRTRLAISAASCAPAAFGGLHREGSNFVVEASFGEPADDCVAGNQNVPLQGASFDLGQLEPGVYAAELRLPAAQGRTLLASRRFTVLNVGETVTLQGRYRVGLTWKTRDGQVGTARPIAQRSAESAIFSFFNLANWEVLVKVLDGCAINGNRWIFLAAATDIEYTLTVTDLSGAEPPYVYTSPPGLATPPLADTAAFSCAP